VGDLELATCVDRVNHDKLMRWVQPRGADRRVGQRSDRARTAGALTEAGREATGAGTPPGGPGSSWLAHRLRDGLDSGGADAVVTDTNR
jgi:hypothetical protein